MRTLRPEKCFVSLKSRRIQTIDRKSIVSGEFSKKQILFKLFFVLNYHVEKVSHL